MDVLKSFQRTLNFLGIGHKDGKFGAQVYVFLVVECVIIVNTICFLFDKWNDVDDRIIALKTISVLFTFLVYSILFTYSWDEFLRVVDIFYNMNYKTPFKTSVQRKKLICLFESNIKQLNTSWWVMVLVYLASLNIIPLTIVFIKVVILSGDFQKIIKENLSLPFPLYYPEYMKTFEDQEWIYNTLVYVIGYSFHSVYTVYAAVLARLVYATAMTAITNVEYEFKLLNLSIIEIDEILKEEHNRDITYKNVNDKLIHFLQYFIKHHQDTYRRFYVVDRGIRWIAATLSSTTSLYICMSIYVIVQKDQIIFKLEESIFFGIWAYAIYLFDLYGQRVILENDRLRNALYNVSWVEKPQWFKKALLIIMGRCCKAPELKPFGLFVLDLNNFAKTMNAAYSYYNLLYKFKGK